MSMMARRVNDDRKIVQRATSAFGAVRLVRLGSCLFAARVVLDSRPGPDKLRFPMNDDLDGMAVFVAVAEAKGFRAAGERLGVSGSAVSQAMRRLEERLGVALVRRTTRSVHLTEAGQRLFASARPALEELRGWASDGKPVKGIKDAAKIAAFLREVRNADG